eukprot:4644135-Pyramimonas_sp.AAC.2
MMPTRFYLLVALRWAHEREAAHVAAHRSLGLHFGPRLGPGILASGVGGGIEEGRAFMRLHFHVKPSAPRPHEPLRRSGVENQKAPLCQNKSKCFF